MHIGDGRITQLRMSSQQSAFPDNDIHCCWLTLFTRTKLDMKCWLPLDIQWRNKISPSSTIASGVRKLFQTYLRRDHISVDMEGVEDIGTFERKCKRPTFEYNPWVGRLEESDRWRARSSLPDHHISHSRVIPEYLQGWKQCWNPGCPVVSH